MAYIVLMKMEKLFMSVTGKQGKKSGLNTTTMDCLFIEKIHLGMNISIPIMMTELRKSFV